MNIFDQLELIYKEIDSTYESIEVDAYSKGHSKKETEYFNKRQLNNQAYFLFMFTRLEDRVRSLSDKLIDDKVANLAHWKIKSTWEIIHKQKTNDSLHRANAFKIIIIKVDKNLTKTTNYNI